MLVVLVEEPVGRIVVATSRHDATRFLLPERPPLKTASGFVAPPARVADAVANMGSVGRAALVGGIMGGLAGAAAAWFGASAQQQRPQAYPPMPGLPTIDAKTILASGMAKPVPGAKKGAGKKKPVAALNAERGWKEKPGTAGTTADPTAGGFFAQEPALSPVIRLAFSLDEDFVQTTECEPNTETHWSLALALLTRVWVDPYVTMQRMATDPAVFALVARYGRNLAEVREKSGDVGPLIAALAEQLRRPS